MEGFFDILNNDTSSSEKTIIESNGLDDLVKKFSIEGLTTSTVTSESNSLRAFSDGEFSNEPFENIIKGQNIETCAVNTNSWQDKFSPDDFCEDSNDIDAVLNKMSQLESEQFQNEPKQVLSKEVNTLIKGGIIEKPRMNQYNSNVENLKNSFRLSESPEEELLTGFNLISELKKIEDNIKLDIKLAQSESVKSENSLEDLGSENVIAEPKPKRIRINNSANKKTERIEKELAKAAKAKEREQKKLEKENQKHLKSALKVVENCVKPDQCIQYVIVNIDESISSKYYGEVIKAGLKSGGYNFKVSKQFVSNLISWMRRVPTIENMKLENVYQQEKRYMLIMDIPEFIHYLVDNTLITYIQSLLTMSQIDHLSIAILGLQRYYKYLRDERNREFKAAVAETDNRKSSNIEFKNLPKIFKKEIDRKLVEVQIFCKNIYIRPLDKIEDLPVFVGECTKAVAQIPYKQAKAESLQQENEFFVVDNRDCVRVDKDGNGLGRLWNQFLKMFPLASLETAEAVTSVYPTIHSLSEAYKNCWTTEKGERLLQDLPVRRAAGLLGGQRKLGPEFSKKAHKFFCSKENVLL